MSRLRFPHRRWFAFQLRTLFGVILLFAFSPSGRTGSCAEESAQLRALVASLPDPWQLEFIKADPYMKVAADLQALTHEAAVDKLRAIAGADNGFRSYVLCRMLFSPKIQTTVQPPVMGRVVFRGGTDHRDWPLEPIEVVDGVPFLIVRGFVVLGSLGGPKERKEYVDYCLQKCDWSQTRYKARTSKEKQAALAKLLASPKWKTPLDDEDRAFFNKQIR